MKYLLFTLSCLFLFSCKTTQQSITKENKTKEVDYCLISGQIKGAKDMTAMLAHLDSPYRVSVKLDSTGSFSDTVRGPEGRYIFYMDQRYFFYYLKPKFNIRLASNFENFDEEYSFAGTGAANSAIMKVLKDSIYPMLEENETLIKQPEGKFLAEMQVLEEQIGLFIENYNGLEPIFVDFLKEEAKYQCLYQYFEYVERHPLLPGFNDYSPTEKFFEPFTQVDFDSDGNYDKHKMFEFIAQHYFFRNADTTKTSYLAVIETAKGLKSEVARASLYEYLNQSYIPGGKNNEAIYAAAMEACPDTVVCANIRAKEKKFKSIERGRTVPDFVFIDLADKAHSLADYRGKYVFIDTWATWCAPCKYEIPFLEELLEAYRDKNIVFMSVSFDSEEDRDKWKNMVRKNDMKGLQFIMEENWESDFAKFFIIRSIPRFILIDKEGKIVNSNMPTPSQKAEIHKILDALL